MADVVSVNHGAAAPSTIFVSGDWVRPRVVSLTRYVCLCICVSLWAPICSQG